jgi:hypothetical protein
VIFVNRGALAISDGYRVWNEEMGSQGIPFVRGGDIGDGWINTHTEDHIRLEFVDHVRAKLTQVKMAKVRFDARQLMERAIKVRFRSPEWDHDIYRDIVS